MLYNYITEKLIGLQDLIVTNIEEKENSINIFCHLKRKIHKCPECGCETNTVHDYREQVIKDIPAFGKDVFLHLKKRRYRCQCGKRFAEDNIFLPKYHRTTNRLTVAYFYKEWFIL